MISNSTLAHFLFNITTYISNLWRIFNSIDAGIFIGEKSWAIFTLDLPCEQQTFMLMVWFEFRNMAGVVGLGTGFPNFFRCLTAAAYQSDPHYLQLF